MNEGKPAGIEAALARVLDEGVAQQVISDVQRQRLAEIAADGTTLRAPELVRPRDAAPFSVVTVAYALGALLVLFACGWFLVDRWARLGAWGVLAVASLYAGVLFLASRWLRGRGFALAADITATLVVSLAPLLAWPFLALAGRWPVLADPAVMSADPLLRDNVWMAWQWLVLELVLVLAALLTLRRRPMVAVTWPLAGALAVAGVHLSLVARSFGGTNAAEQWLMLACGFAILLVAERVERWQRARHRAGIVADGTSGDEGAGDFANAFWIVGLAGTTLAFLIIWARGDDSAWRHILLPLAAGLVGLSLYVRRRSVLLFGVLGIVGYLGFLAEHVFRAFISFPVLLAGLGILVILATVWTQTRFPTLVDRLEARRGSDERPFPWSGAMAALPIGIALAMATLSYGDAAVEHEQEAFRERLGILRQHSGSLTPRPRRAGRAGGAGERRPSEPSMPLPQGVQHEH